MKTQTQILKWLQANLGKHCVAGLTSHDTHALVASVAMTPLISWQGAPSAIFDAYRAVVSEMQPKMRFLAYHAIACELDWSHRAMIWANAGLPPEQAGGRCEFEPKP